MGHLRDFVLSSVLLNTYINDLERELKIKLMKFTDDVASGNIANPGKDRLMVQMPFCSEHSLMSKTLMRYLSISEV